MSKEETTKGIWQKLLAIQKEITTFAISEDSDKKDAKGDPAYKYTPGWQITETIRQLMDKYNLMLLPNFRSQENKLVEYPVYKDFHGQAMSFTKKEMFVHVSVDYTWMDVDSGETAGPYTAYGFGANGTDKSGATAMSMAERYFLLRFFHFTTRELQDEQDAHDSENIPGIPHSEQPRSVSGAKAAGATPVPSFNAPAAQPGAPAPYGSPAPTYSAPAPANGTPVPQPMTMARPAQPTMPTQGPTGAVAGFNQNDPNIQTAITALMNYEKGTPTHQRCLNEQIGKLTAMGYRCMNTEFIGALTDTAQSLRYGKRA